ncbi:MAG: hypothetical protein JXB13_16645 [Phycisphaerae bacterium]|nr:hypothetical protein [Phycisphaerae bacterium]
MRIVSGVGSSETSARVGRSSEKAIPGRPPTGSPVEDTLELSPAGLALSRADVPSPERFTRICEFRAEVEAETFLTPERMDGTVDGLLDVLGRIERH